MECAVVGGDDDAMMWIMVKKTTMVLVVVLLTATPMMVMWRPDAVETDSDDGDDVAGPRDGDVGVVAMAKRSCCPTIANSCCARRCGAAATNRRCRLEHTTERKSNARHVGGLWMWIRWRWRHKCCA